MIVKSTLVAAALVAIPVALAGPPSGFEIAWSAIDGQSDRSVGGGFTLVGHVPESDAAPAAAPAPMTAGPLSLTGALVASPDAEVLTCPGDLDGNGIVDGQDAIMVIAGWGNCLEAGPCPGDVNRDRSVGPGDLNILINSFGPCP